MNQYPPNRQGVAWLLAAAGLLFGAGAAPAPPYRDPGIPVEARVKDLLGRMTLEEKIAQVTAFWNKDAFSDAEGRFVAEKARVALPHGIGQISRPSEVKPTSPQGPVVRGPRENAVFLNDLQRWLKESTRLGIPAMTHEEALHGLAAPKGTHFPIPIGLASAWDPALVERVMSAAALEARARGTHAVLSPVLDLARDPRWGRTEETYGEDPYLVSRLGIAAIRGYQGSGRPLARDKVFATAKHFAVHGPHEGGVNTAPSNFGERTIRDQYLFPFEAALREARPLQVMPSYNEVDGVPSHQNAWLLETVLRGEWGFDGLVVSDYFGIDQLMDRHHTAGTLEEAALQALRVGVDIELPDPKAFPTLAAAVRGGRLPEGVLDAAVARNLRLKFLAGLFEDPFVDPERAERLSNSAEHQALALDAARRSIVLVKNDGGVLPLDRARLRRVAVIGPNAAQVHLGGYSNKPGRGASLLDGIRALAGPGVEVSYAEGTRITEHPANWYTDDVVLGDPEKNRARIQEAVAVAKQADAVVLVIGTNESTSREAWADNHKGDVASLELMGQQNELVEAVAATGKPVVVVFIGGRPQALGRVDAAARAILVGWYLGQEGGTAAAEALFGDVNPGGKLPISFPRSVGQLPVYYGRKPTSFRPYLDAPRGPLYAFGHGLSYTGFRLDDPRVTPASIPAGGTATVSVRVTNTGTRAGDEVVQLYVRDRVASVTRPVMELRGFHRVGLKPGEATTVELPLGPEALAFTNAAMKRVVEPGTFDVMVGASSEQLTTVTLEVTKERQP
jgi:beta-glucosidase